MRTVLYDSVQFVNIHHLINMVMKINGSESYDFSSKSYIFGVKSSGLELLKIMNAGD